MKSTTEPGVLITPADTLEADCLRWLLATTAGIGVESELSADTSAVLVAVPRGVPGPPEALMDEVRTRRLPVLLLVDLIEPWTIALFRSVHGCGVVSWRSPGRVIISAVRASLAGKPVSRVMEHDSDPVMRLSEREREVMAMVALGEHNEAIARRLEISTHTVESHVQHALMKLDVTHRHAASTVIRQSSLMTAQLRNFRTLGTLSCREPA